MKQSLSLRVSQHLSLTPQLQQSIRLLQLSTLEMAQEVEQMLDENPFLERGEEQAEREAYGLASADTPVSTGDQASEWAGQSDTGGGSDSGPTESEDYNEEFAGSEPGWDGDGTVSFTPDDGEWGGEAPAHQRKDPHDEETASAADLAGEHISLQAHLHQQALGLRLNEEERAALYFLIESLNDDGYLDEPVESLAAALAGQDLETQEQAAQLLNLALRWLQNMEPAGVGARDLGECLRLQIEELRNTPAAQAALAMCAQPLDLLARRDLKRLASACRIEEALAREALALIGRLEPKPGRRFANVERNAVVPDVIVTKAGRGFKVQLNPDVMPRLRIHDIYANALRQGRGDKGEGAAGMQQRLQEARWFIKNIQQRFDTILRVSSAIVERQRNFFMHGELAMRPLVLREIADELGLHESTISRVTTAKYMATPFGTYELKYFFGSSLGTETGGNASSTAVRALIKQFVAAEDVAKPLSDSQLSEMLKEQGIECARRTVAKYREALRIAPANLRKR
jgi:RNA polymerase sigma-54 factor